MKNLSLLFAFLLAGIFASAQDSYTIKMTMKIEGLPPEYAAFGEQEMVNYLKGELYRNETSSMLGGSNTAFDGKMLTMITDQKGNKSGFTASKEEMDALSKEEPMEKPKIEYFEETKKIAGYDCSKAILTSTGKEGKENKVTVWITEKIKSTAAKGRRMGGRGMQMDFGELKGYPLQIEMTQNQNGSEMKIVISATDVSTSAIEDSVFKLDTEGYNMMTYKQYKEQMKMMRKGGQ